MATAPKHLKDLDVFEKRYADAPTEYGALYDADGNLVVARHGEEKSIEFTPEELEKAKGGVLSHDHPHGHDLSSADMALALQHNIELRATGHTPWGFRTYSVMPHRSVLDTTPLTQYYEQTYKTEKASGKDPYKAREATVAKTAKQFGMTRKVFNRNDIIREYDEDQPRDEDGRWTSEGGDFGGPVSFDKPMTSVEYYRMAEQHVNGLSPRQRDLVVAYTGDDFQMVNTAMREDNYKAEIDGEQVDLTKSISKLKQTIESSKLEDNVSVYRGFSEKRYLNLEVGSTITDKSFVSTTQNRSIAEDYFKPTSGEHGTPDRKIFQIDLPKGHGALAVAPISKFPKEREVMLNPQSFVVTKIENAPREGGTLTIYHMAPVKTGSHVVHEGLETEEQRAWWFWNLKNGGGYEEPGKGKSGGFAPEGPFKTKFQTNVSTKPQNPFSKAAGAAGAAGVAAVGAKAAADDPNKIPENPFEKALKKIEADKAAAAAAAKPSVTNYAAKVFNKPMTEQSYEDITYHQTDQLTPEQRDSIQRYTGSDYHDINGAMRTGKYESEWGDKYNQSRIDAINSRIGSIKSSINSSSLDKDVSVYRGFSDKRYSGLEVGATIEDKGFVSTSISKGTAVDFYKPTPGKSGGPNKIFQIDLPKGHPALAVGSISLAKSENEIVLNPQKFVVTGINTLKSKSSYDPDTIVYHLSPIGNGKSK